jgi:DNA polymerase V
VTLPYPTDFTPDLVEAATRLLETLYRPGFHYQQCGVMLLDLSPVTQIQASLFDTRDRTRQAWLMRTLDSLNQVKQRQPNRCHPRSGKYPTPSRLIGL